MEAVLKHSIEATVTKHRDYGNGLFELAAHAPAVAREARPGQFVTVRGWKGVDPLVNRPLSIAGAAGDSISLMIKEVGPGTAMLRLLRKGDKIQIVGPLGNAFPEPEVEKATWYVAGGVGLAPFLFYSARAPRKNPGRLFFGCFSGDETCALAPVPDRLPRHVTTEDGSAGEKGLVSDALAAALRREKPDRIFACGPWGMMRAVAAIASRVSVPCFVSLESYMSCGFGACMGCAVHVVGGGYRHVCKDGTVFDAAEIDWNAK